MANSLNMNTIIVFLTEGKSNLSTSNRGRVGVCCAGWHNHLFQYRRNVPERYVQFGGFRSCTQPADTDHMHGEYCTSSSSSKESKTF